MKKGENEFVVELESGGNSYSCLELGGLGPFRLTFTKITLTEVENPLEPEQPDQPEDPGEHTNSFANGVCSCGLTNGFAGVFVWTEGSLTPITREDTESTMKLISTNGYADWWKVKLEWPLSVTEGKTYEVTFRFNSNATGTIKYSVNGASYLTSNEYAVQSGANTFTVRFTAGTEHYSCLELGGLGTFELTFTGIGIQEVS